MKNADMPAMPLTGDAYKDFSHYDWTNKTSYNPECQGLTKREMFTMYAMQALIPVYWDTVDQYESAEELVKCLSESAVEHADALLQELGE